MSNAESSESKKTETQDVSALNPKHDESKLPAPEQAGGSGSCTVEELIGLVRAVKFAHPEMSIRSVHNEISGTMANSDPSYAFLKEVKLNDVKKVWKKALKGASDANESAKEGEPSSRAGAIAAKAVPSEPIVPSDGVLKLYTVGDGSVKTLAENYANHHAASLVTENSQHNAETKKELQKYAHFFLDVPAVRSGSRAYQAVINFSDNHKSNGKAKGSSKHGSKKKGNKQQQQQPNEEKKDIFKIQVASAVPGMEQPPMLLYNSDRSAKTFIHVSPPDDKTDEDNYSKVKAMIIDSGTNGVMGGAGGVKAYFWGFVTKNKSGPDVVSIDVQSGLAPVQTW